MPVLRHCLVSDNNSTGNFVRMMTFSPRVGGILLLMIGVAFTLTALISVMMPERAWVGGWRCGCGEFNPDSSWLCGKCGRAR